MVFGSIESVLRDRGQPGSVIGLSCAHERGQRIQRGGGAEAAGPTPHEMHRGLGGAIRGVVRRERAPDYGVAR